MRIYRKPLPSVTNIQPPKRMDIWYAHLRENTGTSVQEGDRPVLVISNDVANRCSDVVTVLPMTSQIKKMYMPTHCIISDLLDEDSVVLAEQITAIPKWRLRRKLCACEDAKMVADIETAVKVQLGLEDILSITVYSPLKYSVHWFDDTRTKVEMDSNIEDFRNTASYYDGQVMRDNAYRKRFIK